MARILLVENNRDLRRSLTFALKAAGHEVHEAEDGRDAIESLKQHTYALVITEVLLPELDGTEILNYLEGQPQPPLVIAMSGGNSQIPAEMALLLVKLQAAAILQKPVEEDELVRLAGKLAVLA